MVSAVVERRDSGVHKRHRVHLSKTTKDWLQKELAKAEALRSDSSDALVERYDSVLVNERYAIPVVYLASYIEHIRKNGPLFEKEETKAVTNEADEAAGAVELEEIFAQSESKAAADERESVSRAKTPEATHTPARAKGWESPFAPLAEPKFRVPSEDTHTLLQSPSSPVVAATPRAHAHLPAGLIRPSKASRTDSWHCDLCRNPSSFTPMKRRGPNGAKTLCNSCGVRWVRAGRCALREMPIPPYAAQTSTI